MWVVAAAMAQDWWEKAVAAEKGAEVMAPVLLAAAPAEEGMG